MRESKHLAKVYKKEKVAYIPVSYQIGTIYGSEFLIPETISTGFKYSNPYIASFIAKADAFVKGILLGGSFKSEISVVRK